MSKVSQQERVFIAPLYNYIVEHKPDIIADYKSWLSSSVQPAKVLKIYRRDRSDGGVFIACQETLISEFKGLVQEENVEAVICHIVMSKGINLNSGYPFYQMTNKLEENNKYKTRDGGAIT